MVQPFDASERAWICRSGLVRACDLAVGDGVQVLCGWLLTAVVEQLALVLLGVSNDGPRRSLVLPQLHGAVVEYYVYACVGGESLEDLVDDHVLTLKDVPDGIAGRNRDVRIRARACKPQ